MPLSLSQRIAVFSELGNFFRHYLNETPQNTGFLEAAYREKFTRAINKAQQHNGWFDKKQVHFAIAGWGQLLKKAELTEWTNALPEKTNSPKVVGIVMAGNLPLVGFHDLLAVLLSGHKAHLKMASDDQQLLPVILEMLLELAPEWEAHMAVVPRLNTVDAVIATGSTNSTRYFQHYFGNKPNIIRGSRNSAAVIHADITDEQLELLADDIFQYYGLGCRSVSKLYVPETFDLNRIFGALMPYSDLVMNKKYGNNYDYHRAIYMMNKIPFLENGFVIFRESELLHSPVAVVHYQRYASLEKVEAQLQEQEQALQCVVADAQLDFPRRVGFGQAQRPGLADYADGVDTLEFLGGL
ncbi:MAG: acyl-CoA reductase [Schleiferiaceae bacterium]|nr:acyl-CoA reductase [Schleiferiaceae bacterium]